MFYLTIVNKTLRHCHSWLARQYMYNKWFTSLKFSQQFKCPFSQWYREQSVLTRNWRVVDSSLAARGVTVLWPWAIPVPTLFVWFDSLYPINLCSLGWTSTKLGLMFLLKDTTQWRRWGLNPRPLSLESSAALPPVPTWLKNCWLGRKQSYQTNNGTDC